jgi:alpha-glucosidase (family GH31 glycosyl hydrolase)
MGFQEMKLTTTSEKQNHEIRVDLPDGRWYDISSVKDSKGSMTIEINYRQDNFPKPGEVVTLDIAKITYDTNKREIKQFYAFPHVTKMRFEPLFKHLENNDFSNSELACYATVALRQVLSAK